MNDTPSIGTQNMTTTHATKFTVCTMNAATSSGDVLAEIWNGHTGIYGETVGWCEACQWHVIGTHRGECSDCGAPIEHDDECGA